MSNLTGMCRFLVVGVPVALAAPAWAQTASDATQRCGAAAVEYNDEQGLTTEERIRRMDRAFTRSLNRYDACQDAEDDRLEPRDRDTTMEAAGIEGAGAAAGESGSESGSESGGDASPDVAGDAGGETPAANPGDIPGEAGQSLPPGATAPAGGRAGGAAGGISGDAAGEGDGFGAGAPSVAAGGISGDEPETLPASPAGSSGAGREQSGTQAGQAGGTEAGTVAGAGPPVLQNGKLPDDIPPADNDSVLEAQIRQAAIDEPDPELKKKLWNEYRRYKGLPQVD